ncbi:MAG: hypothetical protein ACTHNW_13980 [Mucilaginibacter sp.]
MTGFTPDMLQKVLMLAMTPKVNYRRLDGILKGFKKLAVAAI